MEQFHTPKNVAEAISIEAGELLENFLWLSSAESTEIGEEKLRKIENEIADVTIFIIYLCSSLGINLLDIVSDKLLVNQLKYPVSKAKGSSKKYTEL